MDWVIGIFVVVGVVSMIAITIVSESSRVRRLCKQHVSEHPAMADDVFAAHMADVSNYTNICLAVRRAMAKTAGVPPETVYPDDRMDYLCSLGWDGIDAIEVIMVLEDDLEISMSDAALEEAFDGEKSLEMMRFADWAACLAAAVAKLTGSD